VVPALNRTVTVPAAKPPAWMPERLPVPPPARLRWVVLIVLAVLTLAGCAAALVWMASQDGTVTAAA
jgi:hypothetical protein